MICDDGLLTGNNKFTSHEVKIRTVVQALTCCFYDTDILDELELKFSFVLSLSEE